ncbi:mRNA capping enzyme [Theileria orientalis]|uniref:mRNA guanylyltransferase n=1 Tax=Theileria orientalis TaxID=68886 RepID=A0A976QTH9_THEOR|nr:mRNA capping enzyme [Theileria orientalis]
MIYITPNHRYRDFLWNLEKTGKGFFRRFEIYVDGIGHRFQVPSQHLFAVCEKSDGVRALLLSASGSIFLIGRLEEVHEIKMKLPIRGNLTEFQQLTLLDGEVVTDKADNGSVVYRYLCYDGICIQRRPLNKMNLLERLAFVYTDVILPLRQSKMANIQQNLNNNTDSDYRETTDNLEIYLKDFFDITQIKYIDDISVKLPHVSDGLIFTPVNTPYSPGTCKTLLKWKPPHLNTVDFSIDVVYDDMKRPRLVQLYVADSGTRVFYNEFLAPYGEVYKKIIEMALTDQITQIIVECSWITDSRVYTFIPKIKSDPKNRFQSSTEGRIDYDFDNGTWVEGGWFAERIREDKNLPNHISVVRSVKSSIEDDITFDMLVEEVENFKRNGKVPLYTKCPLPKSYEIV